MMARLDFAGFTVTEDDKAAATGGGDYAPLPPGWYAASLERIEEKRSKTSDSEYLNLMWRLDNNRVVFEMIGVAGSDKWVAMGREAIIRILTASGIPATELQSKGPHGLIGARVDVRLKIEKSAEFGDRNRVVWHRKCETAAPVAGSSNAPKPPAGWSDDGVPF